jgi:hypothetical protein
MSDMEDDEPKVGKTKPIFTKKDLEEASTKAKKQSAASAKKAPPPADDDDDGEPAPAPSKKKPIPANHKRPVPKSTGDDDDDEPAPPPPKKAKGKVPAKSPTTKKNADADADDDDTDMESKKVGKGKEKTEAKAMRKAEEDITLGDENNEPVAPIDFKALNWTKLQFEDEWSKSKNSKTVKGMAWRGVLYDGKSLAVRLQGSVGMDLDLEATYGTTLYLVLNLSEEDDKQWNEGDEYIVAVAKDLGVGSRQYNVMRRLGKYKEAKYNQMVDDGQEEQIPENADRWPSSVKITIPCEGSKRKRKALVPIENSKGEPLELEQITRGTLVSVVVSLPSLYRNKQAYGLNKKLGLLQTVPRVRRTQPKYTRTDTRAKIMEKLNEKKAAAAAKAGETKVAAPAAETAAAPTPSSPKQAPVPAAAAPAPVVAAPAPPETKTESSS